MGMIKKRYVDAMNHTADHCLSKKEFRKKFGSSIHEFLLDLDVIKHELAFRAVEDRPFDEGEAFESVGLTTFGKQLLAMERLK